MLTYIKIVLLCNTMLYVTELYVVVSLVVCFKVYCYLQRQIWCMGRL